jgi:hypothetical protein
VIVASWSQRDRRTLAVGSAILALLLIVGRGLPASRRWIGSKHAAAIDVLRDASAAERGVHVLPVLAESLRARQERLALLDSVLLHGATLAEAGASLASVVADFADNHSVRIAFVQVRPDSSAREGLARVAVRASGVGDIAGLMALLQDIESDSPMLAVREMAITQPDPAAPESRAEALHFEVLVEGIASIRARRKTQ